MSSFSHRRHSVALMAALSLHLLLSNFLIAQTPPITWEELSPRIGFDSKVDPTENKYFGFSSDISGNTIVIGAMGDNTDEIGMNEMANSGAAFVVTWDENFNWKIDQKIVPSDREADAYFGGSVAIFDDYLIVGADGKDYLPEVGDPVENAGASYLYHRSETGFWEEERIFVADEVSEFAYFGYSVDIYDGSILVGAFGDNYDENGENYMPFAGAVYGFEYVGDTWVQNQKLVASDRAPVAAFGSSIDMDAIHAYIGAPNEDGDELGLNPVEDAGAVYLFDRAAALELLAEAGWIPSKDGSTKITSGVDRDPFDYFGYSLDAVNSSVVVGAPNEDKDAAGENVLENAGAAYLFSRDDLTNELGLILKVTPVLRQENEFFGVSTTAQVIRELQRPGLSGQEHVQIDHAVDIIVGSVGNRTDAMGENELPGAGSAVELIISLTPQVVQKKGAVIPEVIYQRKIVAPNRAAGDDFGISVAVEGNTLVAGADLKDYIENEDTISNSGSVYIGDLCPATYDSIRVAFCDTFFSPSGKYAWSAPGIYYDTIPNMAGCDSIITIELTKTTVDLTVVLEGNSLMSSETDAEYQWLNCDLDFMPVAGATNAIFSPEISGNYAVRLIKGPCTDTSECQSITITSTPLIDQISAPKLYPNPGTGAYIIDLGQDYTTVRLEIFNAIGQSVLGSVYSNLRSLDFTLEEHPGIFTAVLRLGENKIYRLQFVKQ